MDFLGPINGRSYLVIVDAYTKWVELFDMATTTTSAAVIEKMYEFMSRFGLVEFLITDNFSSFCSQEFVGFCNMNGITHLTSPSYHPASNGQAESYVKIVKKGIKSSLMSSHTIKECKLKILKYLFDYRNSLHSTTGFSPAYLVFGRKLRTRLDLINPSAATSSPPSAVALANFVKNQQCMQVKARGGKNQKGFSKGDNVLYRKFYNNKFIWRKGVIIQKIGKVVYLVKDCETSLIVKKHKNQIMINKCTNNDFDFWDDNNTPQQSSSEGERNEESATVSRSLDASDSLNTAATSDTQNTEPAPVPEASDFDTLVTTATSETTPMQPASAADSRSPDRVTVTRGVRRPPQTSDDEDLESFKSTASEIPKVSARTLRRQLRKRPDS